MASVRFSKAVAAVVVALAGVAVIWRLTTPDINRVTPASSTKTAAPAVNSTTTDPSSSESVVIIPIERSVGEIRHLPDKVGLTTTSVRLAAPELREGLRRIVSARKLTDKEKDGEFISPRWSPDGLSLLMTRPGYQGVYVLDPATGEMRKIADDNGYKAAWTEDGRIAVPGDDGIKYYNADGSTSEFGAGETPASRAWAENDTIYISQADGSKIPLTGTDDRYFNPVTSPDGSMVVFQGLINGLYIAPTDGSQPPRWIGRGSNPSWMPDGSGFVYDRTTDDGHHLNSGNLIHIDVRTNEISNLTQDDPSINQMPQVGPGGRWIVYEAEGQIVVGQFQ